MENEKPETKSVVFKPSETVSPIFSNTGLVNFLGQNFCIDFGFITPLSKPEEKNTIEVTPKATIIMDIPAFLIFFNACGKILEDLKQKGVMEKVKKEG